MAEAAGAAVATAEEAEASTDSFGPHQGDPKAAVAGMPVSQCWRLLDENPLLNTTDLGPYCQRGDFFIDPWRPIDRAVVTQAHADH